MKKIDFHPQNFREMTEEETLTSTGGSFAYDVGSFLRFVGISGPYGLFTPAAIMDAYASACL